MITRFKFLIHAKTHSFFGVCGVAGLLQFGALASSAQTGTYLFTGSETNITLNPGLYDITAYGAQGGSNNRRGAVGGLGAEMGAEFSFTNTTTLTLLVGGGGGSIGAGGSGLLAGGGGGGSFVVSGTTPLVIAAGGGGASPGTYGVGNGGNGLVGPSGGNGGGGGGAGGTSGSGGAWGIYRGGGGGGYSGDASGYYGGSSFLNGGSGGTVFIKGGYGGGGGGGATGSTGGGGGGGYSGGGGGGGDYLNGAPGGGGGSYIDPSPVAVLAQVSGVASPDASGNGMIIITVVPQPGTLNYHVMNGNLVLEWAQGTLLSAGTLNGSYAPVNGASSPYTNSMTGPQQYFRVQQ
jgi:hypothetical protein